MLLSIQTSPRLKRLRQGFENGFSLVITLMMMVMLSILAVGLLSLASIQTRTSSVMNDRFRAQANARLALQLAIARLQSDLGPDQRVTATAEIVGSKSHPRWVGVWRSTQDEDGGLPVVSWDKRDSYLTDTRTSGGQNSPNQFEHWLVSGDPGKDPEQTSGELVRLVGPGTVADGADHVKVPLVEVDNGSGLPGGYAFWCADESMKASLNVPAPASGDEATGVAPPDRFGVASLPGLEGYDGVDDEDLAKVIDYPQAELAEIGDRDALKEHYHSIGTRASSVLADTLRGGLKRDLSVFLENGSVDSAGDLLPALTENTPLLEGSLRKNQGPKMGALRSYAMLASRSGSDEVEVTAAVESARADKFAKVPDLEEFTSQPIHPVIASAEVYTRFCYVRGYLTVHLYPRIVLWNPYNAKLASQDYTVDFNHCINDSLVVERRGTTTEELVSTAYDTRNKKENRMSLTLEATSFEPGEALVFTPKPQTNAISGLATPLATRDGGGTNLMSASVNPNSLTNFYLTLTNLKSVGVSASDLPLYANHNKGAYYWVDMMDWYEGNPDNGLKVSLMLGSASRYDSRMRLPLLQLLDSDNWRRGYQGRYNNGRWRVGGVEPIYDFEATADFEPWARGCYGFRYKWWVEKNPFNYSGGAVNRYWGAAVTADYNVRAAFCHRSPYDGVTDNGEEHHWYMWGPYTCDRQQGLPYLSPEKAAHPFDDKFRGNVFYAGSSTEPGTVYPVYDLPRSDERIVSLGRFEHAQLTPFIWHASYPIGNSWVPPNLKKREATADRARTLKSAWSEFLPYLPTWLKQSRGDDVVIYDLAYEANHELWDRYFLSGALESEKKRFAEDPAGAPLANSRLVPVAGRNADPDRLAGFYEAASELLLAGAFNVNSTDPEAWHALLSSLNGRLGAEGSSFSRFQSPEGGAHDPGSPYESGSWGGFRSLEDDQIAALAEAIVEQVKLRGPFLSVSDFVNRRLVTDRDRRNGELGLMGPLQKAILDSGINDALEGGDVALTSSGYGQASYEPGSSAAEWGLPEHLRTSKAAGMPTYLQQGDLLQPLGSTLVARGDTFTVRAYGEARSKDGKQVTAKAWCEAVVQRLPDYVNPADAPETPPFASDGSANPALSSASLRFGRRFSTVSFRWLSPSEI
ncbi:pilus assembly PilX family protein [Luteolibacter marinus]|uniref:pilus assembly PilX family protein n=1 Tax=Luteolibacter marinus TaxID=2776705 RepID=UPI001866071E|nr:hypothetical protein [Luteolibacter marinus]